ncbi:MAG: hypothetical protein ACE5GV_08875, partial [Candidatus Scalindua sp.]
MNCPYTLKFLYIKLGVNLNWFCTGIGPPYLYDKPVNVASQSGKIGKQEEHYNVRFKHEETQYTDKLLEVLRGKDEDVKAMVKSTIDIAAQKEYKRLCLLDYNEWVAERCPE